MNKPDLDDLMQKFESILSSKKDTKNDASNEMLSVEELKAALDKDTLGHKEAKDLLKHIARHSSKAVGFIASYIHDENDHYTAGGGVIGDPSKCALGVLTLLKSVLDVC